MTSSVILNIVLDDNLKVLGVARELTNKIQKLRKSSGVQIDDAIEVFFSQPGADSAMIKSVLENHSDKIKKMIKKPFLPLSDKKDGAQLIAEEEFVCSHDANDKIMITICKASGDQIQS